MPIGYLFIWSVPTWFKPVTYLFLFKFYLFLSGSNLCQLAICLFCLFLPGSNLSAVFFVLILPVSVWIKPLPTGYLFNLSVPTWFKPLSVSYIFHFARCYLDQTFANFFLSPFCPFLPGSNLCKLLFTLINFVRSNLDQTFVNCFFYPHFVRSYLDQTFVDCFFLSILSVPTWIKPLSIVFSPFCPFLPGSNLC